MQSRRSGRYSAMTAMIAMTAMTACIDGTGPRPRPGSNDIDNPLDSAALAWYELQPRVINHPANDTVTITVAVSGRVQRVTIQLRLGPLITLDSIAPRMYSGRLSTADMVFGYRSGDLRQTAGIITVESRDTFEEQFLIVNVKDATIATATVSAIGAGVQATEHVVNVRLDTVNPGVPVPASALRAFYERFSDEYDFIGVVEPVRSARPPFYINVRNDVSGIGLTRFDNGATYGSAARLEGIVQYPDDVDFDPARTDNLHELGHRWMNYLNHPLLAPSEPHWPLSSLAVGIIGWTDPATGELVSMPFDFTRQGDGTYLVRVSEPPRTFNDVELYLMGLLPPDSVRPQLVFADQNQRAQLRPNGVLRGRVDSLSINDIIASDGARVPAAATAPRDFRMATIVLSRGRMLSRDELAFFEHIAARGEQRLTLPYSTGAVRGSTLPFFLATGGRATLTTRLAPR
ncbi:MAG: hypothetical protein ACT4O1_06360 [Gemmatimonadota bacterium]